MPSLSNGAKRRRLHSRIAHGALVAKLAIIALCVLIALWFVMQCVYFVDQAPSGWLYDVLNALADVLCSPRLLLLRLLVLDFFLVLAFAYQAAQYDDDWVRKRNERRERKGDAVLQEKKDGASSYMNFSGGSVFAQRSDSRVQWLVKFASSLAEYVPHMIFAAHRATGKADTPHRRKYRFAAFGWVLFFVFLVWLLYFSGRGFE